MQAGGPEDSLSAPDAAVHLEHANKRKSVLESFPPPSHGNLDRTIAADRPVRSPSVQSLHVPTDSHSSLDVLIDGPLSTSASAVQLSSPYRALPRSRTDSLGALVPQTSIQMLGRCVTPRPTPAYTPQAFLDELLLTYSELEVDTCKSLPLEDVAELKRTKAQIDEQLELVRERIALERKMRSATEVLRNAELWGRSSQSPLRALATHADVMRAIERTDEVMQQQLELEQASHDVQMRLLSHHVAVLRDKIADCRAHAVPEAMPIERAASMGELLQVPPSPAETSLHALQGTRHALCGTSETLRSTLTSLRQMPRRNSGDSGLLGAAWDVSSPTARDNDSPLPRDAVNGPDPVPHEFAMAVPPEDADNESRPPETARRHAHDHAISAPEERWEPAPVESEGTLLQRLRALCKNHPELADKLASAGISLDKPLLVAERDTSGSAPHVRGMSLEEHEQALQALRNEYEITMHTALEERNVALPDTVPRTEYEAALAELATEHHHAADSLREDHRTASALLEEQLENVLAEARNERAAHEREVALLREQLDDERRRHDHKHSVSDRQHWNSEQEPKSEVPAAAQDDAVEAHEPAEASENKPRAATPTGTSPIVLLNTSRPLPNLPTLDIPAAHKSPTRSLSDMSVSTTPSYAFYTPEATPDSLHASRHGSRSASIDTDAIGELGSESSSTQAHEASGNATPRPMFPPQLDSLQDEQDRTAVLDSPISRSTEPKTQECAELRALLESERKGKDEVAARLENVLKLYRSVSSELRELQQRQADEVHVDNGPADQVPTGNSPADETETDKDARDLAASEKKLPSSPVEAPTGLGFVAEIGASNAPLSMHLPDMPDTPRRDPNSEATLASPSSTVSTQRSDGGSRGHPSWRMHARVRYLEVQLDQQRRAAEQSRHAYEELRLRFERDQTDGLQEREAARMWTEEWRRFADRLQQQHHYCERVLGKADGREEMDGLLDQLKASYSAASTPPPLEKSRAAAEDMERIVSHLEEHISDMAEGLARAGASGLGGNVIAQLEDHIEELESQLAERDTQLSALEAQGRALSPGAVVDAQAISELARVTIHALVLLSELLPTPEVLAHSMSLPLDALHAHLSVPEGTAAALDALGTDAAFAKACALLCHDGAAAARAVGDDYAIRVQAALGHLSPDVHRALPSLLEDVFARLAATLDTSQMITERAIVLEDSVQRYADTSAPVTPNPDSM